MLSKRIASWDDGQLPNMYHYNCDKVKLQSMIVNPSQNYSFAIYSNSLQGSSG